MQDTGRDVCCVQTQVVRGMCRPPGDSASTSLLLSSPVSAQGTHARSSSMAHVRVWLAAALAVIACLHCASAVPPSPQKTLSKPTLLTADSAALTGPFGPGSVLDYFNKTPQLLEGTLYPLNVFQVTLGQLFYGLEPVRALRQ